MDIILSSGWVRRALEEGSETALSATTSRNGTIPNDPESLAYVAEMIRTILEGRVITGTYNIAIVAILIGFSVAHWRRRQRHRRRWRERITRRLGAAGPGAGPEPDALVLSPQDPRSYPDNNDTSSSSSSTIHGTATPPVKAGKDIDIERIPLVAPSSPSHGLMPRGRRRGARRRSALARIRGWLAYQPRPLPIINRTLPSNAVSLFVLGWLVMNAWFFLWHCPLGGDFLFVPADRAGFVFIVNLPLLYLIAAKNQPLGVLTGRSYEALNIFHRRVGEFMCFVAAFHLFGMLLFQFLLAPDWLNPVTPWEYLTHRLILLGFGAWIPYELLYLTSLASFRQWCYELFLAVHVVLQLVALVFLYLHFYTARPYVLASAAIFIVDRLVWRLRIKSSTLMADVVILEDGETLTLSADWDIPSPSSPYGDDGRNSSFFSRLRNLAISQDILSGGWEPSDHVFLTIPALGRSHALQAHPFTIASAAPNPFPSPEARAQQLRHRRRAGREDSDPPTHAWLNLLIRTHSGFTRDLLIHARQRASRPASASSPSSPVRLFVRLDGPYGSSHALDLLRASDAVVLVAGGSGIAVVYPLAAALLLDDRRLMDEVDADFDQDDDDDDDDDDDETMTQESTTSLTSAQRQQQDGKVATAAAAARKPRTRRRSRRHQRVHLLWVTRSRSHASWIPSERLDELVAAGLDLVIPEPTREAGRPDTAGLVRGWIDDEAVAADHHQQDYAPPLEEEEDGSCCGGGGEVGVVVSGPDGLNREVRNVCAAAIGEGARVRVAVEKFGW